MWTVTTKDDHNLLIVKAGAVFDYRSLRDLLTQIYVEDGGKFRSYDRFADLSGIEVVDVATLLLKLFKCTGK
jgi:hypothetical protein